MTEDAEHLRRNVAGYRVKTRDRQRNYFSDPLSDAHRELASLLQRPQIGTTRCWMTDKSLRIKNLMMRSVPCAPIIHVLADLGNLVAYGRTDWLVIAGFMAIAERQLKNRHRTCRGILLFFWISTA